MEMRCQAGGAGVTLAERFHNNVAGVLQQTTDKAGILVGEGSSALLVAHHPLKDLVRAERDSIGGTSGLLAADDLCGLLFCRDILIYQTADAAGETVDVGRGLRVGMTEPLAPRIGEKIGIGHVGAEVDQQGAVIGQQAIIVGGQLTPLAVDPVHGHALTGGKADGDSQRGGQRAGSLDRLHVTAPVKIQLGVNNGNSLLLSAHGNVVEAVFGVFSGRGASQVAQLGVAGDILLPLLCVGRRVVVIYILAVRSADEAVGVGSTCSDCSGETVCYAPAALVGSGGTEKIASYLGGVDGCLRLVAAEQLIYDAVEEFNDPLHQRGLAVEAVVEESAVARGQLSEHIAHQLLHESQLTVAVNAIVVAGVHVVHAAVEFIHHAVLLAVFAIEVIEAGDQTGVLRCHVVSYLVGDYPRLGRAKLLDVDVHLSVVEEAVHVGAAIIKERNSVSKGPGKVALLLHELLHRQLALFRQSGIELIEVDNIEGV